MISGNISSKTYEASHAGLPMVNPYLRNVPLDGDDAVWPSGLILGKDADGKRFPYGETTELIGTGDGSETDFEGQVGPIQPGTASVVAGAITLTDDGCGNLAGTGGSGSINYETGKMVVAFSAAPANDAAVNLTFYPDPYSVLDVETDTASASSAMAVNFGAVRKADLKVGVSAQSAPSDAVVARLECRHIYPV